MILRKNWNQKFGDSGKMDGVDHEEKEDPMHFICAAPFELTTST